MFEKLLFVDGRVSGDKRHDELVYAACKAHVSKNAHRKRKRATKERRMQIKLTVDTQSSRCDAGPLGPYDEAAGRNSPWLSAREKCARRIPKQGVELIPAILVDPITLSKSRNDQIGNPAIAISPQMNYAIMFAQHHLTKSQAPTFVLRLLGNGQKATALIQETELRTTRWLWNLWIGDTGLFSSIIASVLPLMIRRAPVEEASRLETLSMDLKSQTFVHLRVLLAHGVTQPDVDLFTVAYYVKSLFRESCARGDIQGARCHLRMLEQLVTRLTEFGIDCSRVALWSDSLPALLQMRRPIRNVPARMSCIIQQVWIDTETVLPNTDLVNTNIPVCVISHVLRYAFLHLRKASYVTHVSVVADESEQKRRTEKLFQWLTTKAEYHIGRLLEFFFDLSDSRSIGRDLHALSQGQRFMELSFALCLLHLYQKSFFDIELDNGSDVHESAFVIYPLLTRCVQLAETFLTAYERALYEGALFWVLFVGSCAEEKLYLPNGGGTSNDLSQAGATTLWFQSKLMGESARREIVYWSDASRILDQFVWDKSLETCVRLRFVTSVLG